MRYSIFGFLYRFFAGLVAFHYTDPGAPGAPTNPRLEELRGIVAYLQVELRGIHEGAVDVNGEARALTTDEDQRFNDGVWLRDACIAEGIQLERRLTEASRAVAAGHIEPTVPQTSVRRDPFDMSDLRFNAPGSELRGRALTAVESVRGLGDAGKAQATELLERHDTASGALARHILATGNPLYREAFGKLISGRDYALTADEARSVDEARAASLTDAAGGYAVPFTLDPTIIDTGSGSSNPFRQIARVVPIVTDKWNGVSSAGVTAAYAAEGTEASDNAPTLAQPNVPVHRAQAFVPFSFEIGQDWVAIESDLRNMIQVAKDDLEADKFCNGSGSNQPTGLLTAIDGTSSEIAPTTAETFAFADVYKLDAALPAKYRQNGRASWLASHDGWITIRRLMTALSSTEGMWVNLGGGQPPEFFGYSAYEASGMDDISTINAAATADNFVLALGDFSNYVIAERVGLSVELIPHLFATGNNRPSGQRGLYAIWRNGADSVNDGAFRVLSIPTAA